MILNISNADPKAASGRRAEQDHTGPLAAFILILFLLSAFCFPASSFAQAITVTWNFSDFALNPVGINQINIIPLQPGGVLTNTFLVPRRIGGTVGTNSSYTTNLVAGYWYQVILKDVNDPDNTAYITNYFPQGTTGAVNAVNFIPTNAPYNYPSNVILGVVVTNGNGTTTTNGGVVYVNPTGGGGTIAASNTVGIAGGIAVVTNAGVVTIISTNSTNATLPPGVITNNSVAVTLSGEITATLSSNLTAPFNISDVTVTALAGLVDFSSFNDGLKALNFHGNLVGHASDATNFTGTLTGNVTGTQGATVVSSVPLTALPAAVLTNANAGPASFNNNINSSSNVGAASANVTNTATLGGLTVTSNGSVGQTLTVGTLNVSTNLTMVGGGQITGASVISGANVTGGTGNYTTNLTVQSNAVLTNVYTVAPGQNGVVGNGVADDTAAIQAILNKGGIIEFSSNRFYCQELYPTNNDVFRLNGANLIYATNAANTNIFITCGLNTNISIIGPGDIEGLNYTNLAGKTFLLSTNLVSSGVATFPNDLFQYWCPQGIRHALQINTEGGGIISGFSIHGFSTGIGVIPVSGHAQSAHTYKRTGIHDLNIWGCMVGYYSSASLGSIVVGSPFDTNWITNAIGIPSTVGSPEYMEYHQIYCFSNVVGAVASAGNCDFIGCSFCDNTTAQIAYGGVNSFHGSFVGCHFGHNSGEAVHDLNMRSYEGVYCDCWFDGSGTGITLDNCSGIKLSDCFFDLLVITNKNTVGTYENFLVDNFYQSNWISQTLTIPDGKLLYHGNVSFDNYPDNDGQAGTLADYFGNGSGLTNLNGSSIASGTIAAAVLATNGTLNTTNLTTVSNLNINGTAEVTNATGAASLFFSPAGFPNSFSIQDNGATIAMQPSNSLGGLKIDSSGNDTVASLTITGNQTNNGTLMETNVITASNLNNSLGGTFTGNGGGLTNLNAGNLVGNVPIAAITNATSNVFALLGNTNNFTGPSNTFQQYIYSASGKGLLSAAGQLNIGGNNGKTDFSSGNGFGGFNGGGLFIYNGYGLQFQNNSAVVDSILQWKSAGAIVLSNNSAGYSSLTVSNLLAASMVTATNGLASYATNLNGQNSLSSTGGFTNATTNVWVFDVTGSAATIIQFDCKTNYWATNTSLSANLTIIAQPSGGWSNSAGTTTINGAHPF